MVTLKDIAQTCDCGVSTVSYALRRDPKIPASTAERIRSTAQQLGYRQDPLMRQLMRQVRLGKARDIGQALAFLNFSDVPIWSKRGERARRVFEALRLHAEKQGYHLDEIWLKPQRPSPVSLRRILKTRGIRGILVSGSAHQKKWPDLNWNEWGAVSIDHHPFSHALPRVMHDHFEGIQLCFEQLQQRGYQKIGLALSGPDSIAKERWQAGYLLCRERWPQRSAPVFITPDWYWAEGFDKSYLNWHTTQRPDVVISNDANLYSLLKTWKDDKILGAHGFAALDCAPHIPTGISGIEQHYEPMAQLAVDVLIDQLERYQCVARAPSSLQLVPGSWHQGTTTR